MPSETSPQTLAEVADQFSSHRPKMFAIAHRTLGSPWAADDAVQEAWIRLQRADISAIDNLEAWLTTAISRVCIDALRRDAARREDLHWEASDDDAVPDHDSTGEAPGTAGTPGGGGGGSGVRTDRPEDSALLRDDLTVALHVILDTLGPLERLALVLHDIFALSYDDIAPIVDRSPVAARQLASRARARLRKVDAEEVRHRQETAITSFLEAARGGDFGGLLQLLDPEIEVRSDPAAVSLAEAGAEFGAPLIRPEVVGRDAVARVFNGRAKATELVCIDGVPAAAYISDGVARALYLFHFADGRVASVDIIADENILGNLPITR